MGIVWTYLFSRFVDKVSIDRTVTYNYFDPDRLNLFAQTYSAPTNSYYRLDILKSSNPRKYFVVSMANAFKAIGYPTNFFSSPVN